MKATKEGKQITVKGSYRDLLADVEAHKKIAFKNSHNREEFERYSTSNNSHSGFAGGEWEDVTSLKNMDSFKKALADFKKQKLEEKVKAKIDFNPKRKRSLSEHDGDWDYDKQWEIKPFSNSRKEMLPINVVDINVDMSISSGMRAEEINKYGALVWSIIQIIESIGIQANINIINDSHGATTKSNAKIYLQIKKSGEYISPIALATCFQSVFYRRAIFCSMVMNAEQFNEQVSYGLGSPATPKENKYVYFKDGAIYTRAGGMFNANEVESAILKLLGKDK